MNKYWKIIVLTVLTVLIIGSFYSVNGIAGNEKFQVEFEKVSGNEKELDSIWFSASYEGNNQTFQELLFNKKELVNIGQLSFVQSLQGVHMDPVYQRLVKEHRSFMRGKYYSPSHFYEDEKQLISVDVNQQTGRYFVMNIDTLDKKSGEKNSIKLDYEDGLEKYNWMSIDYVDYRDGMLHVLARGYDYEGTTNLNVYTFDLAKGKLDDTKSILTLKEDGQNNQDIYVVSSSRRAQKDEYVVLSVETTPIEYEEYEVKEENTAAQVKREVYAYNLKDKVIKELPMLNSIEGSFSEATIEEQHLLIPEHRGLSVEITSFNLEKEVKDKNIEFEIQPATDGSAPFVKLMNGKIYSVIGTEKGISIQIGDAKSGDLLYKGIMHIKRNNETQTGYSRLYVHEIMPK